MVSIVARRSRASPPLMSIPDWAARPRETVMAAGTARPIAQGHAMMRTAMATERARAKPSWRPPVFSAMAQTAKVNAARARTAGTKMALARSARRCMGARLDWAWERRRCIWARVEAEPTAVARRTRGPSRLRVPPETFSPTVRVMGRGSPVSMDSSMELRPWTMRPSRGMRSPGRTRMKSLASMAERGRRVSGRLL